MQVCADPSDSATLERERRRLEAVTPTRAEVPADAKAEHFRRFHGTVALDPTRVGRDASRIADEVIAPLAGQLGAVVKVTLEIDATLPAGLSGPHRPHGDREVRNGHSPHHPAPERWCSALHAASLRHSVSRQVSEANEALASPLRLSASNRTWLVGTLTAQGASDEVR